MNDPIEMMRSRLKELGSQTALAEELGISKPYLCDMLKGRRDPGEKVFAALGIRKVVVVTFEPIEARNE